MAQFRCAFLTIKIMENKIITIEELEIGDEILISCQSFFKYLRVLATPKINPKKLHWSTKQPLYGTVKCSTRQEEKISYSYTDHNGNIINRMHKAWIITPDDHNRTMSVELSDRQLFLVKKG